MLDRPRKRIYDTILQDHLHRNRQMAFLVGPRQVGKTTVCRTASEQYLDWDNTDDRAVFLAGPKAVATRIGINRLRPITAAFDELHKFRHWKRFLKGFFDTYSPDVKVMVTGSSRLDVYRRGGDSLMGRYFQYRMHPFSIAELASVSLPDPKRIVRQPTEVAANEWAALWEHGGFPEPFLRRDAGFTLKWNTSRRHQLLREDVRDLTEIRELDQLEVLVGLLGHRSGRQLIYSKLAAEIQISQDTLRRWICTLTSFGLGFVVKPWFRNVAKAIRKEPKWYLRDWSQVPDDGQRVETFMACHLLKAVDGWNDMGLGTFELRYLRDKMQREVDFVVIRDHKPWMLVEAKKHDGNVGSSLAHFQKVTKVAHAFQALFDADYLQADCFSEGASWPKTVPMRTLLSQLM
jgi:predicted AAA+ superfamily ATPase